MLAPGPNLVTMTGDGLCTLADARLGADKVKRDLLGTLPAPYVIDVLVFVDAICNTAFL